MPAARSYSQWCATLAGERLPAAIVDLDAFDRNLKHLSEAAAGKPIRLATKSVRVPELIRRALALPAFRGLMCYSAEEAAFLHAQGFDDFLIAYPTVQASDLTALRALREKGAEVSLVIDASVAPSLAAGLGSLPKPLPVLLDLDLSLRLFGGVAHLGVRRSPIRSGEDLKRSIETVKKYPQLKLVGMMGYEAQVAGLGDRNPFKRIINPIAHWIRKISMARAVVRREEAAAIFTEHAGELRCFNGGGTGSLNWASSESALTEVTAGSALFSPHLFDYYSNIHFEPSCFFALQAVRSSDDGYVTCQGGGYVASGEPGWDRVPIPHLPQGAALIGTEGCGEVQTPLKLDHGVQIEIGAPVFFRHSKAGELMERFNEVLLVEGGKVSGRAKTYRGHGQCYY
jgi:D-serine deaminase-like pyridoxal phosphate-dependent protein